MSSASMPPSPPPLPKEPTAATSTDSKKLVPILVVIGVLMCGCIALPVLAGGAMLMYLSSAREAQRANVEAVAEQFDAVTLPGGGTFGPGSSFDGPASGGSKEAARQNVLAAEQALLLARAQYEAMQGVYEQQRDFQSQQAGRLGAQGISLPPPQPPDPQLYQNVLAAEAQYEAAKAAFDAAQ